MVRNHGIWGFPLDSQTISCGLRVRFRPSLRQPFVAESMTKSPADPNTILVPRISVWAVKNPPVNIQDVEKPAFLRITFQGNNGFSTSMWTHPRGYINFLGCPNLNPTIPNQICGNRKRVAPDLWGFGLIFPSAKVSGNRKTNFISSSRCGRSFGNLKESERNELKWGVGNNL